MSIEFLFLRARHKLLSRYSAHAASDKVAMVEARQCRHWSRVIVPVLLTVAALTTTSCKSECIFGTRIECQDATATNPSSVLRILVKLPKTEFRINEGVRVRVTVQNVSTVSITIPDQRCSRPFYVDDLAGGPMADQRIICNNNSYPGAKLSPGDSLVWEDDIRSEIKDYGKDFPTGEYWVYGRVFALGRVLYSNPKLKVTISDQ